MKRSPKSLFCSPRAVVALVAALGGAACSEGPERTLGDAGLLRLGGGPAYSLANVCEFSDLYDGASGVTDGSNIFGTDQAALVQLRSNRARFEMIGDAAPHSIGEGLGTCAAPPSDATAPTVSFTGGHAIVTEIDLITNVRTVRLNATFGPLLFPGNAAEPGVVVGNDIAGGDGRNVLEIIWPGLAGTGVPGSKPIVRVQMSTPPGAWRNTPNRYKVDIQWDMDAVSSAQGANPADVMHLSGAVAGIPVNGTTIFLGPPAATSPCEALTGGTVTVSLAGLVQNSNRRLRFEVIGDVPSAQVRSLGSCAAADPASVIFTGGDASITVTNGGITRPVSTRTLTFGQLLFPGVAVEPGVVVANDINGGGRSVLEIIWPDLAGGAGAPIFRVQLDQRDFTNRNRLVTGAVVHYLAHFNAVQLDPVTLLPGASKTFTVIADFTL